MKFNTRNPGKQYTLSQARNQGGRKGAEAPLHKFFVPLGKMC